MHKEAMALCALFRCYSVFQVQVQVYIFYLGSCLPGATLTSTQKTKHHTKVKTNNCKIGYALK